MKRSLFARAAAIALALAAAGGDALAVARPVPVLAAYAGPAPIAAPEAGAVDKLREAIRGGLINLAVAFTNAGTAIVTNRMIQAGTAPKNIGWGTGTTAAAVTDTQLVTEAAPTTGGGRTVGTESRVTTTVTNDTYQVAGTVTSATAGSRNITEAGLFDAVSAGAMLIRGNFTAIPVDNGDSIAFTFGLRMVANVI